MKRIAILLGFCLVVAMLPTFIPQPVHAMTGSGTAGDPYVIYNVTDLQNMANDLSAYYELANDIDASATSGWNGGAGFVPVGNFTNPFTGHFDGNNYTISDLYINRGSTDYIGLFGYATSATLSNVEIHDATIWGRQYMGILIGRSASSTTINYVGTSGVVDSTGTDTGGLAGYTSGTVYRCWSFADVDGNNYRGGLIGTIDAGTVEQCFATGDVTGTFYEGGGLIGFMYPTGTITDCYARGSVIGGGQIGGLVGHGRNGGYITNSYSTGLVSGTPGYPNIGGLVGWLQNPSLCTYVVGALWDTETSERGTSWCGLGKSTAEMKTQATYTGWNFSGVWLMGGSVNDGYPYLDWWYNPPDIIQDVNQVVWFQPNAIIEGIILPNRAQNGTLVDGEFTWGANPEGITISHGDLIPEEEYDFEPVIPDSQDIIKPEPETMTGDVDTDRLHDNPLYPLVAVLAAPGLITERLAWLLLAWFILIAAMLAVHLGFDTRPDTEKPQHFILTTITGLGLSILFYTMGIFPLWVVILMAFGLVGAIIWERQPVL